MTELVFTVESDEDGGYVARTKLSNGSIIAQGDTLDELKTMIKDAVSGYFFDKPQEPFGYRLMKYLHWPESNEITERPEW